MGHEGGPGRLPDRCRRKGCGRCDLWSLQQPPVDHLVDGAWGAYQPGLHLLPVPEPPFGATVQYLTPNLMIAILVMIYMGFLVICSWCCILSLQTPEKFEGDQEKDMARALNQDAK